MMQQMKTRTLEGKMLRDWEDINDQMDSKNLHFKLRVKKEFHS